MPIIDLIQFRRGIASLWTSVNTLLSAGEPGFETDKYRLKVGDGTKQWNSLLYLAGSGVPAILAGSGISVFTGVGSVGSEYYNQPNVPFYIIHSTGVIGISGGSGISVTGSGGIYTISNTGVISISGGSGISVSGSGGYYTITNTISITGGNGISVSESSGIYTITNTGVISITGGSGISVTGSDGVYTVINTGVISISGGKGISVTGSGGLYTVTNIGVISISPGYGIGITHYDGMYTVTNTGVISISGGNGISIIESSGFYTIETTGLSVIGHTHTASNITDFNSAVSGLLTGYSVTGHTHTASNITDFNSAVSGLLPVKDINSGAGINVSSTNGDYTIAVSGLDSSYISDFNEAVDDRIGSGLFVAGTGINLIYNDAGNTFTVSVTDLINNPANNRILTSRDSTTTGIDAESNLTFDGSLLSVSGNLIAKTGILDIISFNTNNGAVSTQGQLGWNNTEGTLDIALQDNLIAEIGEHRLLRVRNSTGNTLYKGQAVYASGVHANGIIEPNLYIANGSIEEIRFIGMMLADVNHNNNGYAIDFGHINNIDTRGNVATDYAVGDETWADGDILYIHPTQSGKLTKVKPKHAISLAFILNAAHNGKIFVRPTNFGHLNELHDVNISGATNGQFLQYNSGIDYWVPSSSGNFTSLSVNGTGVSLNGHTHTASQITDFNEAVDDRIGSGLFVAGTGINLNYNDSSNNFTVSVTGLINNPSDNRILTSRDNTTTGIDAESNLTFDGTNLIISSGLTASTGNFTTSISGSLLNIDNIRIDSNTISSTNSNGNININPAGSGSIVLGSSSNNGNAPYSSIIGGIGATTSLMGEIAHSNGNTAFNSGATQHSIIIAKRYTANGSGSAILTLDGNTPGSTNRLVIPSQSYWSFIINLVAYGWDPYDGSSSGEPVFHYGGSWIFRGFISRDYYDNITLGTPITEIFNNGLYNVTPTLSADYTNFALQINVDPSYYDLYWSAIIDINQITTPTPPLYVL